MPWSLDWFAAEPLAKSGSQIRRVGWTDKVLIKRGAVWQILTSGIATVVKATDFGVHDLNARDWTDQPFNADPCAAVSTYNTAPIVYGQWTPDPVQLPPPVPGFAS